MTDPTDALRTSVLADPDVPEPVRRFLASGAALEEIRLSARGAWTHQGEPFVNRRLSALFHRSLIRTDAGTWLLRVAPYHYPVIVDGEGAFVTRLSPSDAPVEATLACGKRLPFVPDALWTDGEEAICWDPPEGMRARLVDQAYLTLASRLEDASGSLVWRRPDGVAIPVRAS